MPQQVISVHVGHAGVHIGDSAWELLCLEHGVDRDGTLTAAGTDPSFLSFFHETEDGKHEPRAVFVDSEPTVVDTLRKGPYRQLYHPDQLVAGKEDAANIFSRGQRVASASGERLWKVVLDRIRRQAEQCSDLQGFLIYHSFGGGTGSGLTSQLLEELSEEYGTKNKVQVAVYPSSKMSTATVEPYNCVLGMSSMLKHADVCILADNKALYDLCLSLGVEEPHYRDLNRLLCQAVSSVTAGMRFNALSGVNLQALTTALVPHDPALHFPLMSYAPLLGRNRGNEEVTVEDITAACLDPGNEVIQCDPRRGEQVASLMLYRGEVTPTEVKRVMAGRTRATPFATRFQVGISGQPPSAVPEGGLAAVPRTACHLSNTTAIVKAWESVHDQFDAMIEKLAFNFWFHHEGLGVMGLEMARNELASLVDRYEGLM